MKNQDLKTRTESYTPHEAKLILDFIEDSETRLEGVSSDTTLNEVVKTTFSYLKRRAKLHMDYADGVFARMMDK